MKVIIAGSRSFNDYNKLKKLCDLLLFLQDDIEIVSGTAKGADQLGERYAEEKGYKLTKFPANWEEHGKSAGYKRNVEMANYADTLIVFWNSISKGTGHMINIAKDKNLKLYVYYFSDSNDK